MSRADGCWPRWGAQPSAPPAPASPALARVLAAPRLRASPGQGTAPVNPSPFSHHEGKKSPCKAAVGWSRQGGRGGGQQGALTWFSLCCSNPSIFTSAWLCPSSKFTINHAPGGGMLGALERWVLRMGSRWRCGGAEAASPRDDISHLLFGSTKRESWWGPARLRAEAVPGGRWPSGRVLSVSRPSA